MTAIEVFIYAAKRFLNERAGGNGVPWDRETGTPRFPGTFSLFCPVACSLQWGGCGQEHESNGECGMTLAGARQRESK